MSRRRADGGWRLDNLALSLASARLAGAVAIGADQLATGEFSFSATNLDDLSPLVLTKMSGALQAKVSASAADGRQAVAIAASSDRMAFGANRFEGLKVDLNVGDLWGARSVSGLARLSRAEVAGQTISDVKLTATGRARFQRPRFHGLGVRLRADGARAIVRRPADPARPRDLHRAARRPKDRARRARHDRLTAATDSTSRTSRCASIPAACRSQATPGPRSTSAQAATALPLAALDLVSPGLGASGTADGDATIRGTPSDPSGDWRIRLQAGEPCRRRAATRCRRSTWRLRAGSPEGGRRSTSRPMRAAPIPFA